MQRRDQADIDIEAMNEKQLRSYIRNAGKRANQRLVELERADFTNRPAYRYLSSETRFRPIMTQSNLSTKGTPTTGSHLKFNLNTRKDSLETLRLKARAIQGFLKAKTSSVATTKRIESEVHQKVAKTFESKYLNQGKAGITFDDMGKLWDAYYNSSASKVVPSERIIELGINVGLSDGLKVLDANMTELADYDKVVDKIKDDDWVEVNPVSNDIANPFT